MDLRCDDASRRTFLKMAGMGIAVAAAPGLALGRATRRADRAPVLTVAHLTDLHIQPELAAAEGLAKCLQRVQSLPVKPGLVITGGDLVMDAFDAGFDRAKTQFDLVTSVFKAECSLPVRHCLGNHDIFGWNKTKSKTTGTEKGWGKAWACEAFGLSKPWYSFEQAGWHFIILDSVAPNGEGYIGRLLPEQMDWLKQDLASAKGKPVCVVSHIPVLSMCAVVGDGAVKQDMWRTPGASMHADGSELHRMFCEAGNVKLCLSGHIHLNDRVELGPRGGAADGPKVTYICDGAVCGAWWKGRGDRCDEGFGVVDFFADGSFSHRYETFGWKTRHPEPK